MLKRELQEYCVLGTRPASPTAYGIKSRWWWYIVILNTIVYITNRHIPKTIF